MIVLASILIGFVFYFRSRERNIVRSIPSEIPTPGKYRGLIFIYSNNDPVLRKAVEYHSPILDHCWILTTPEMKVGADAARAELAAAGLVVETVEVDSSHRIRDCYEAVVSVHNTSRVPSQEIIADMTGGTKPMSAGVLLACYDNGYPLQHVAGKFDEMGKKADPARPIEIQFTRQSE
jgi:hypothetical protein